MAKQTVNDQADKERAPPAVWRLSVRHYWPLILSILLISLVIHGLTVVELGRYVHRPRSLPAPAQKKGTVKFKVAQSAPKLKSKPQDVPPPESEQLPKILETPQAKTLPPKQADYAGTVDHTALKQTRVAERLRREKAADAGQKGKPTPVPEAAAADPSQAQQLKPQGQKQRQRLASAASNRGNLSMAPLQRKPRNAYEALLPTNVTDLPGQMNAGYQDFVDDKVEVGDRIDMNTSEYRYIGYFTSMRKAIELVWNYPMEAARKGEQGEVGLQFIIAKDGKVSEVKVLKTSGFPILDQAVVEAIRAASPFAPLPDGFRKTRLVITGGFRYVLGGF